jgi:CheY-like chemotaxis protein
LLDGFSRFLDSPRKDVVVFEIDKEKQAEIAQVLGGDNFDITLVKDVRSLKKLLKRQPDCIVVGSNFSEDALEALQSINLMGENPIESRTPLVVYGDGGIDDETRIKLSRVATVSEAQSPDRLLDRVALRTHRNVRSMSSSAAAKLESMHQSDVLLAGRKVLVVDDDARNIFALTSVLEDHNMNIVSADNGREAINILQRDPEVDIVLMDIMMPEMDGMETIREIRKISELKNLPIVAVTAKAMKGDREKCIEAGAWDYLSKPVDIDQMMTVLRAWLYR